MPGASPQAGFSAEELERALMNLRRAARGTADDTGAIRCLLDYLSTHTAHVAAASQAVRGPFRAVFTVPTPCWTAQALAELCHEEAGTAPDGPVGAEFALYLAGTLDHDQVQTALETLLREAVPGFLAQALTCAHGRPLPSHPACAGRCPECDREEATDLRCYEARRT